MAKRIPRRTLKAYTDLYHNPESMVPGVHVVLFPGGKPEIWITDGVASKHGLRLHVGKGKAGLSLTIDRLIYGATPLTVRSIDEDYQPVGPERLDGVREVTIVQYNADERSQAFNRWYSGERDAEITRLLGPEYGVPRAQSPRDPTARTIGD